MKKTIALIAAAALLAIGIVIASPAVRAQSLPACATDGDMDSDGVPDAQDSDETDSCLVSSSGYEDCSTGAGDGIPDCQTN